MWESAELINFFVHNVIKENGGNSIRTKRLCMESFVQEAPPLKANFFVLNPFSAFR